MDTKEQILTLDQLTNAIDSFETAYSLFDRTDSFKWKWVAFAMHHSLYSFCITSLTMGNPGFVMSSGKKEDEGHYCQIGSSPWLKSCRVYVDGGPAYRIKWEPTKDYVVDEDPRPRDPIEILREQDKYPLIGFWTALARVQDSTYWMARLTISNALELTDEEIKHIVWLHNHVRNGLMHFKPKSYTIYVSGIRTACTTILKAVEFLALHSHTFIWPMEGNHYEKIGKLVSEFRNKLDGQALEGTH